MKANAFNKLKLTSFCEGSLKTSCNTEPKINFLHRVSSAVKNGSRERPISTPVLTLLTPSLAVMRRRALGSYGACADRFITSFLLFCFVCLFLYLCV